MHAQKFGQESRNGIQILQCYVRDSLTSTGNNAGGGGSVYGAGDVVVV